MYLKEIKAYGFKSFADKTSIEFGKNINGIVGPNGSGKSNIVDAVRWVLGEQSMKSLRGDNSLDVIFSGSDSRRALNSASVTLVFDNTDRSLPIDFNEVSIKRMAFFLFIYSIAFVSFSSNSPRYFVPATILPKSNWYIDTSFNISDNPSTMAVLPTPAFPINKGLFFCFFDKIYFIFSI